MKITRILGIVLLTAGVILLILGIYQFVEFRQSLGGKVASLGNQLSRAVGGSSKLASGYVQPIILFVSGIVSGVLGLFLIKKQ